MRKLVIFTMGLLATSFAFADASNATPQDSSWKVSFKNTAPSRAGIKPKYCKAHVPDKITASLNELKSTGGVQAKNGVYLKFDQISKLEHNGKEYADIIGEMSGTYQGKYWIEKTFIHEQERTTQNKIKGAWSNLNCKGDFVATRA